MVGHWVGESVGGWAGGLCVVCDGDGEQVDRELDHDDRDHGDPVHDPPAHHHHHTHTHTHTHILVTEYSHLDYSLTD